jgi:transcriptional regulator with XRE-family HTH domain
MTMDADLKTLADMPDAAHRAKEAAGLLDRYQAAVNELSRIRREAVEEMIASGMSHAQIAEALGVSRGRVSQLTKAGPPPERVFWGTDALTVALGGKLEAPTKASGEPGPVLAQEDFQAYQDLSESVKAMGLATTYEIIQPPGTVRLNRDNLVVICGPRLSPLIAQIIEADPVIAFDHDDLGWYLNDRKTGSIYRSPMDEGKPADIGYLARLPRPDARGTFLYIAGIHAMGSSGVIHYLDRHLADVYREVKTKRFSALIQCEFDPETRKTKSSSLITPLYAHGG